MLRLFAYTTTHPFFSTHPALHKILYRYKNDASPRQHATQRVSMLYAVQLSTGVLLMMQIVHFAFRRRKRRQGVRASGYYRWMRLPSFVISISRNVVSFIAKIE